MAENLQEDAKQGIKAAKKTVDALRQKVPKDAIVDKSWQHFRTAIFLSYLVVAEVIFLILAFLAKTIAYFTFDVTITRAVQEIHAGWFDALMYTLTWIGFGPQVYIISIGIIVFLYVNRLKWEALVASGSVIGSTLLELGIKLLIQRPRPSADLVNVVSQLKDYSFPSGHVLYFTTFMGFMLFLAYTLLKHSWWRTMIILILGGMIALIGLSRIYEGQHWASDVIAAYLLGSLWLTMIVIIYHRGKPRFFPNEPGSKNSPPSSTTPPPPPTLANP